MKVFRIFLLPAVLASSFVCAAPVSAVEYAGRLFRDPFEQVTSGEEVASRPAPSNARYVLKGVFWSAGRPQALINDQIARIGDKIGEAEVLDIRKDGVKMRDGENEIFLKFKRGAS